MHSWGDRHPRRFSYIPHLSDTSLIPLTLRTNKYYIFQVRRTEWGRVANAMKTSNVQACGPPYLISDWEIIEFFTSSKGSTSHILDRKRTTKHQISVGWHLTTSHVRIFTFVIAPRHSWYQNIHYFYLTNTWRIPPSTNPKELLELTGWILMRASFPLTVPKDISHLL